MHSSPQLQLIDGKLEVRRSRGRPRNTCTTDITTAKGMKYVLPVRYSDSYSDSELFIRHCLPSNSIAQICIINVRRLPLRQLVVADMGAT